MEEGTDFFRHLIDYLLPDSTHLKLEHGVKDSDTGHITLSLTSTQVSALCSLCQQSSERIHSNYERTLRDLNWADCAVTLQVTVKKFFCENRECERRIFTERLPQVGEPWARRTNRMSQQIRDIGLELGGAAGARLSQRLGYSFSRDTILRCLTRIALPAIVAPKTLGVDDFAFRKGQRYGTVLVDLDQHRPIALLPDREASTLAAWLKQHSGIEVLSRDRSKTYRQGMSQGAPDAVQVADRFHLLQNLVEPLEQVFGTHRQALNEVESMADPEAASVVILPPAKPLQVRNQRHQLQRQMRYQKVIDFYHNGWSAPAIAHHVGISVRTVQRYLKHEQFPERQPRSDLGKSSTLGPYKGELLERWNAGCYEARALFRAIQQKGYRGSYMTVARYVRRLRQAQGFPLRQMPSHRLRRTLVDRQRKVLTARRAAWACGTASGKPKC